ncbi:MAG: CNNM domain-containing protein [Planctomycetaceae bacterium]|nr:CNNM domain-containing protein [Planctomycetaceae bacterium]
MDLLTEHIPAFLVMAIAAVVSAFCSASEAVFFSISSSQRRKFIESERRLQRLAGNLAAKSREILPVVLLGNLTVNLILFAVSTITSLRLQKSGYASEAGILVLVTLFGVIIFCEMLPKTLGVTIPRHLAPILAAPLSLMVRLLRPFIPVLEKINILSQRLLLPDIRQEPYLQVSDLERMIELTPSKIKKSESRTAAQQRFALKHDEEAAVLLKREQQVLRNIVNLSDATAEEMMRPRTLLPLYRPPVTLDDLQGTVPTGGYLLITESDTDEIASAISLDRYIGGEQNDTITWNAESNPVVYVPCRMKAAAVLETLQKSQKEVAAVVNEYGETIGILTFDDLVYSIFAMLPSRSRLLLHQSPIRRMDDDDGKIGDNNDIPQNNHDQKKGNGDEKKQIEPRQRWQVSSMTTLRQIERFFRLELPEYDVSTVGGILQEALERLPKVGDECDWGAFHWRVLAESDAGTFDVEISILTQEKQANFEMSEKEKN